MIASHGNTKRLLAAILIVTATGVGNGTGADGNETFELLLALPLENITQKEIVPPGTSANDYLSLAIYWWPNSLTGIPYVYRDGKRNPEADRYDASRLNRFIQLIGELADAWKKTGDPRYAESAAERIRVWFLNPATAMSPHFEHAQFVPGITTGTYHGIIEANGLARDFLSAVGTLEPSGALSSDEMDALRVWFRKFHVWMRDSHHGKMCSAIDNNIAIWMDYQRVRFCLFADDQAEAERILRAVPERRIARQIRSDGSMPAEMARTRSFDYVCYGLDPLLRLAEIAEPFGIDLWTAEAPNGGSIKKALSYALHHTGDGRTWPGRQIAPRTPARLIGLAEKYVQATDDPEIALEITRLRNGNLGRQD